VRSGTGDRGVSGAVYGEFLTTHSSTERERAAAGGQIVDPGLGETEGDRRIDGDRAGAIVDLEAHALEAVEGQGRIAADRDPGSVAVVEHQLADGQARVYGRFVAIDGRIPSGDVSGRGHDIGHGRGHPVCPIGHARVRRARPVVRERLRRPREQAGGEQREEKESGR